MWRILLIISFCLFLAACAGTPNPVLYPNNHLMRVGQERAKKDIDDCKYLARRYGVSETKDGNVAGNAAGGAALGGATSGAWGLVRGDAGERALAGAAAGAAGGTVRGAMKSSETSSVFKNFVQRCLRERGYEVIGWQ